MLRRRQACGADSIWPRHSWPQPAFSGQRVHDSRRRSGRPCEALRAAWPASTRDRHHLAVLGADHDARAAVGHEGARQPAPEEEEDPQPHEDGDTEDQLEGGGHGESPLVRVYASADSKGIVRLIRGGR